MNLISQNKETITVELTPLELEIFRSAMSKEIISRRKTWDNANPTLPEELIYHAVIKEVSELLLYETNKRIKVYKSWGVLK